MSKAAPLLLCLPAALAFVLTLYVGKAVRRAWNLYRQHFQEAAQRNLAVLFLFIDPRRLFVVNLLALAGTALLALALGAGPVLSIALAIVVGVSPRMIYSTLRTRRMRRSVHQLPDALLSIATSLRSGMSLPQALETVITHEPPPLGQELALVLRELRIGVTYTEALDNLHQRIPQVEVQLVAAAMKVSREIGGNLAEALERISETLRRRLQMEGKIRSLTAQGKLQGLVMTGLPIFLGLSLYQLEPRAMRYLFDAWYGWATVGVIVLLEMTGYHFIRKIVNIDV